MRAFSLAKKITHTIHGDHHKLLSARVYIGEESAICGEIVDIRTTPSGDIFLQVERKK